MTEQQIETRQVGSSLPFWLSFILFCAICVCCWLIWAAHANEREALEQEELAKLGMLKSERDNLQSFMQLAPCETKAKLSLAGVVITPNPTPSEGVTIITPSRTSAPIVTSATPHPITVTGYIYASKQQEADDNIRLASYIPDLESAIANLELTAAEARKSLQNYDNQYKALINDIRERKIDHVTAAKRFAEIKKGREKAIGVLGEMAKLGNNLDKEFDYALTNEKQKLETPQKKAQTAAYEESNKHLNEVREKKELLTQKTKDIEKERLAAQDKSTSQSQAIDELFVNNYNTRI